MTNTYANHHSSFIASQEGLNPSQKESGGSCIFSYFSRRFVKDSFFWAQVLLLGVCLAYPFICDVCPTLSWSLSVCWWTMVSSLMLLLGPWISLTKIRKILQGTVAHRACCSLTVFLCFSPKEPICKEEKQQITYKFELCSKVCVLVYSNNPRN